MTLYTINGVYPDKNFNFTVTASDLGLVPESHEHAMTEVTGLTAALASKAPEVHSHTCVTHLSTGSEADNDTIYLTSSPAAGHDAVCNISISNQNIVLDYSSPEMGVSGTFLNSNETSDVYILQLSTVDHAPIVAPAEGHIFCKERTIDLVSRYADEFIKKIRISEEGQNDIVIKRAMIVEKLANGSRSKEVWPIAATRLNITTNYDFSPGRKLTNSPYAGPTLAKSALNLNPIKLTVTPYPEDAAWKLGHSDNITHSTLFDSIFTGKQTITVPFSLVNSTGEWEDTWLSAYPASELKMADPVLFRFWCLQASGDTSTGSEVSGETGTPVILSQPIHQWTFQGATPLTDIINGKSLETTKNPTASAYSQHIVSDGIGDSGSLKNIMSSIAAHQMVVIDGHEYDYSSSIDNPTAEHAKYAWYCAEINQAYYTEIAKPVIGTTVYNQDESDSGFTVTDTWISDSNYYETNLDFDEIHEDVTITYYARQNMSYEIQIGQGLLISGMYTNRIATRLTMWNGDSGTGSGVLYPTFHDTKYYYMWTTYWSHLMEVGAPEEAYTAERKYGFIQYKGLYIRDVGFPFARDPLKDVEGLYAFSFTPGGLKDNDTIPQYQGEELPVVYSESETPENWSTLYDAEGNALTCQLQKTSVYKLEFRDERWSDTPFIHTVYNNKGDYNNPVIDKNGNILYMREMVYLDNGVFVGAKMGPETTGGFASTRRFAINIGEGSSKNNYFSDIRIYNRALTKEELLELRAVLWGADDAASNSKVVFNPSGKVATDCGLNKIHVGDGWYIYNPKLTVFAPTSSDPYAARYGWEIYSGEGNEHLWTANYPPTNTDFCFEDPQDAIPNNSLRVQQRADIQISDYPFSCKLIPFVIDSKTVAIGMWTHDAVIRYMRTRHPYCESTMKFSEMGKWKGDNAWCHGTERNLPIWDAHVAIQHEICNRADTDANWSCDGNPVTIRTRCYETPFGFEPTKDELQWRNCKPDDDFYATDPKRMAGSSFSIAPEIIQIAYLTLGTPMTPGSTHTITWCNDSCTVTYGPQQYCSTIKVNQEGYLPFNGIKRYAYLGRWMSTESYMPDENDRTFYVVPSGSIDESNAVFNGTMTNRCYAVSSAGICSDRYAQGNYADTKPITGENTFEMDFSNLTSVTKQLIVADGTTYYRDVIEDWTDGTITITNGTWTETYNRTPDSDTCNAFAWTKTPTGNEPAIVYTDKHAPTTSEQARSSYDATDSTEFYDVTASTEFIQYGWTTERVVEADYKTAQTVWTTAITGNSSATKKDGTSIAITDESSGTTSDISGKYQIYVPNIGWSFEFMIHPDAIARQFWMNMRGLFHQRGGCDYVKHPYTNWEHPNAALKRIWDGNFIPFSNQAKDVATVWQVDPESHEEILDSYGARIPIDNNLSKLDVVQTQPRYDIYGGWMDAADYDLRELHLPIINVLAGAYILFPDNFTDNQLDLPESGDGIPDILDEAIWGVELYRRAQEPDGGIRGWFETGNDSDSPHVPWKSSGKYFACVKSKLMSIQYAGPAARLAIALKLAASKTNNSAAKAKMEALAKVYTESACAAWEYGTKDYKEPWTRLPDEERVPEYFRYKNQTFAWLEWIDMLNDRNNINAGFKDTGFRTFLTVTSLYALTKESRFKAWLTTPALNQYIARIPNFDSTVAYDISIEYVSLLDEDFPDIVQRIKAAYVAGADKWIGYQSSHAYRWHYWKAGSSNVKWGAWGSTHADKRGMYQVVAWLITGNEKYRNAIINAYDHMCGCNPLGRSFVPGVGKIYPNRYLDHWVRWDIMHGYESAMPGVTPSQGSNYPNEYAALEKSLGMYYKGRDWMKGGSADAFPLAIRRAYGQSKTNWREPWYFKRVPIYQGPYLYCIEDQGDFISVAEWTVNETIASKAAIAGMLMIPGVKTKPSWKQIDRVKRDDNLGNTIILP